MTTSAACVPSGYGAVELQRGSRRFMTRALVVAALLHLAAAGAYHLGRALGRDEPPTRTVRVVKYSELGPPPSIASTNAPAAVAIALPTAQMKPSMGVPVPVADEEVAPEQTIPTQQELAAPVGDLGGEGEVGAVIEQDVDIANIVEEEAPPPDFVPFEKEPVVVKRVEPAYPEAARAAGVEGTVWAKLWIDKHGRVKEVVILKSPSDLFRQATIDAAKQWVFTPAVMNSGPVDVWTTISFKFTLSG
jgi:protein TonB